MKEVTVMTEDGGLGWKVEADSRRKGESRSFYVSQLEGSDVATVTLPWSDLKLFIAVLQDMSTY